jgi:hypothetical protein
MTTISLEDLRGSGAATFDSHTYTLTANYTVSSGTRLEIQSGETLAIPTNIKLTNYGRIINRGAINNNEGIIDNFGGEINNESGGEINNNNGGLISNGSGTINNNGKIYNYDGALFYGEINEGNRIMQQMSVQDAITRLDSEDLELINQFIEISDDQTLTVLPGKTLTLTANSEIIISNGGIIDNLGIISNNSGGTINNDGGQIHNFGGEIYDCGGEFIGVNQTVYDCPNN